MTSRSQFPIIAATVAVVGAFLVLLTTAPAPAQAAGPCVWSADASVGSAYYSNTELCATYTNGGAAINFKVIGQAYADPGESYFIDDCAAYLKVTYDGREQKNLTKRGPVTVLAGCTATLPVTLRKPAKGTLVVVRGRFDVVDWSGRRWTGFTAERRFRAV